jgi:hypothetical protein
MLGRRIHIDGDTVSFSVAGADLAVAEVEPCAIDEILFIKREDSLAEHSIGDSVAGGGWQRRYQDQRGDEDQQKRW